MAKSICRGESQQASPAPRPYGVVSEHPSPRGLSKDPVKLPVVHWVTWLQAAATRSPEPMQNPRWTALSLLACSALAFGCADASDEELTDESSDDSAPADVTRPDADLCANAKLVERQDGDSVGYDMSTPENALAAYACLREAPRIDVQVDRRGKPATIEFEIK